jgi:hypothetical protein
VEVLRACVAPRRIGRKSSSLSNRCHTELLVPLTRWGCRSCRTDAHGPRSPSATRRPGTDP